MLDFLDTTKKLPTSRVRAGVSRAEIDWPWKTHQYAKFLREVKGMTWPAVSEETGVPERTLQSWAEKEVWKAKGEDAVQVEEFTRQRFLELTAANGMPKQKAVELLVEGMTVPTVETVVEEIDDKGKPEAKKKIAPDYNTRHKYQKDYWTLSGLYSTNKQMEINNQGSGTVNVQVILPEKK